MAAWPLGSNGIFARLSKVFSITASMKSFLVKLLLVFNGLALLIASSCNSKKNDAAVKGGASARPKNVVADGYVVKSSAFSNTYTASGSLLPNEEVELHPEVAGRITTINFREGARVRKGQLLIQLYDADVRAQIQKLQAQKSLQQATARRQAELLKIGGIARQDYDVTVTSIASTNADIAAAQANLSRMRILAPFDATIGLRNVSLGAVVSPTTVVATLQQLHPLKMDFSVPDQYRDALRIGQEVRFLVNGRIDTLLGHINAIDPGADVGTRTIRVRATVPNANGDLTPGSFAHVVVPLATNPSAILIPSQAIIPTTRDKDVALVRNGKAQIIPVRTGLRTSDRIEITSGLKQGDTILTTGLMQVKPGMDVKVRRVIE